MSNVLLFVYVLLITSHFRSFVVAADTPDATVLGTRRAATLLAFTDVGALRLPHLSLLELQFFRKTRIQLTVFVFLPTGRRYLSSTVAHRALVVAASV